MHIIFEQAYMMIVFYSCMGLKRMCFVISGFPKIVKSYSDHNTENEVDSNATDWGGFRGSMNLLMRNTYKIMNYRTYTCQYQHTNTVCLALTRCRC